jgi:hypothetical protein
LLLTCFAGRYLKICLPKSGKLTLLTYYILILNVVHLGKIAEQYAFQVASQNRTHKIDNDTSFHLQSPTYQNGYLLAFFVVCSQKLPVLDSASNSAIPTMLILSSSKTHKARQSKFKVDFKFKVGLNSKSG